MTARSPCKGQVSQKVVQRSYDSKPVLFRFGVSRPRENLREMPEVSGAIVGAMPQVFGAILVEPPQVSGAVADAALQVSGAGQNQASRISSVHDPTGGQEAQAGKVHVPDVVCIKLGDRVRDNRLQESLSLRSIRFSSKCYPCEAGIAEVGQGTLPGSSGIQAQGASPGLQGESLGPQGALPGSHDTQVQGTSTGQQGTLPGSVGAHLNQVGASCGIQDSEDIIEGPSDKVSTQRTSLRHDQAEGSPQCSVFLANGEAEEPDRQGGNLNLLLGYDEVSRSIGSSLGCEDLSLINLGTSSIATMYRVTRVIKEYTSARSNSKQDCLSKTGLHEEPSELAQGLNVELHQRPEPSLAASVWLGPSLPEDQSPVTSMFSGRGNRAEPCDQVALGVWSCLLGNSAFVAAVAGSALPCCCTYFNTATPTHHPGQMISSEEYPVGSQKVELAQNLRQLEPLGGLQESSGAEPKTVIGMWGPCPHLKRGFCRYGDKCRYEHVSCPWLTDQEPMPWRNVETAQKTVPGTCKHFQRGFCRYGDLCRLQHTAPFTPTKPTITQGWSAALPFSGQQVCPHFQKGFCKRGQACGFQHIPPEGTCPSPEPFLNEKAFLVDPPRSKHPPLCAEARRELQSWNLLTECFKFHAGHCSQSKCGFHHSRLAPERKAVLMKWIAPDTSAVSEETKEQEVQRPETAASGSQGPGWHYNPREPISLRDAMAQDGQDARAASRKFTAPRPELRFQKGIEVSKLGSTILKSVSGASQRVMDRGSVDRPIAHQPCVIAPPITCKPVAPRVFVKLRPRNKAGAAFRHLAGPTGIKRRTQVPNAPGTRMRAVKPQCVPQPSPVAARVPWADLQDSDEEGPPDSESSSAEDVSTNSGTRSGVPLSNQREFLDSNSVDGSRVKFPRSDSHDIIRGTNPVAQKGEHKPNEGISSTPNKLETESGPKQPSAATFRSLSAASNLGSGESRQPSVSAHMTRGSRDLSPFYASQRDVQVRGRSPTPRLSFSPEPVLRHRIGSQGRSLPIEPLGCSPDPMTQGPWPTSFLRLSRQPTSVPLFGLQIHEGGSSRRQLLVCPAEAGGGDSPGNKKKFAGEASAEERLSRMDHEGKKLIREQDPDASLSFDMTLGYPGEGPAGGPKTPPKHGVLAPKTPPKHGVSAPETPPKNRPSNVPPWNRDLEDEFRGLSRSYLERQFSEVILTQTESRRVLGPPKASVSKPKPTSPPWGSRGDVRTAAPSASITASKAVPLPPPRVIGVEPGSEPKGMSSGGSTSGTVGKVPPPPPPRRRGLPMPTGRIVKAKFPTNFDYEKARAAAKACPEGYRQTQGLPSVRPGLPFNPSTRLNPEVYRVDPKGEPEQLEVKREPFPRDDNRSRGGPVRPTPKIRHLAQAQLARQRSSEASTDDPMRSDDRHEQAHHETGPSLAHPPGANCDLVVSEEPRDETGGIDPESSPLSSASPNPVVPLGSSRPESSPKPAVPKVPQSLDLRPQPGPLTPTSRAQEKGGSGILSESEPGEFEPSSSTRFEATGEQSTADDRVDPNRDEVIEPISGELSSSSSELEVRPPLRDIPSENDRPEPVDLKVPQPLGGDVTSGGDSPEPADPKVPQPLGKKETVERSRPEPVDPKASSFLHLRPDPRPDVPGVDAQTLECESMQEHVALDASLPQSSILEATELKIYKVKIQLDADEDAEFRLLTLSGEVDTTVRVHRSRRICEILMMAWKAGFRLKELVRYLRSENRPPIRLPASTRDQLLRTMIGSVFEATFSEDNECPTVQINYPLIRTVLGHPQATESSCQRCDPLRPAWLFFSQNVVSEAFILDRSMRLRAVPAGTLLRDALRELDSPGHSLVGLCRSMRHWTCTPRHFRAQPAMCLWIWPVPEA